MRKTVKVAAFVIVTSTFLAGCMNMPTPTSQITASYVSGLRYEAFDCSRLSIELDSLARRENQLVIAQEQRVKTSEIQAFWWGYGQGDGIEASELANVRGEKEAIRRAMEVKRCGDAIPSTPRQHAPPPSTVEKGTRAGTFPQEREYGKSVRDRLEELKRLKEKGLINDKEYEKKKEQILKDLEPKSGTKENFNGYSEVLHCNRDFPRVSTV